MDFGDKAYLKDGAFMGDQLGEGEVLPEHLCGGTFKSRGGGKKRKAKPKITYKEQKERRIRRKFGVNGVACESCIYILPMLYLLFNLEAHTNSNNHSRR